MSITTKQQSYSPSLGIANIPSFVFRTRDPSTTDNSSEYPLYTQWVNTNTKAIWYLESLTSSNGVVSASWRAVAPIVKSTIAPLSTDYLYPEGQTWVDTTSNNYWVLVDVTGTTATWVLAAAGTGDLQNIVVDTVSGTGTNPVLPIGGSITVTANQVAQAAVGAQCMEVVSQVPGQYSINIQKTSVHPSSDASYNGVSHFNSAQFNVTIDGFVSLITNTVKPKFLAIQDSAVTNVTGDGTAYTVIFNNVIFQQLSGYNNATGVFTVPETGTYRFTLNVTASSIGAGHTIGWIQLSNTTSGVVCRFNEISPAAVRDSGNQFQFQGTVLLNCTAADQISVNIEVNNSTKTVGVLGSATYQTMFSGEMVL